MIIKDWQEKKLVSILCAFEQSSTYMRYDKYYTLSDGYMGRKQVTLSIGFTEDASSSTQGGGTLNNILGIYILLNGQFKSQLEPFMSKIGKGILADSDTFKALIVEMGKKDPAFGICQELAYRQLYLQKAYTKCDEYGIKTALGAAIFQDSFLQGGLDKVANLFRYPRPSRGGDEIEFLKQYLIARRNFLLNMDKTKGTVYRIDCFEDCIRRGNWDLSLSIDANGIKI